MTWADGMSRQAKQLAERETMHRIAKFWNGPAGEKAPSDANDIRRELAHGPLSVSELAMLCGLSMSRTQVALIWGEKRGVVVPSKAHDGTWLLAGETQ